MAGETNGQNLSATFCCVECSLSPVMMDQYIGIEIGFYLFNGKEL
jgi:hypothetical protein